MTFWEAKERQPLYLLNWTSRKIEYWGSWPEPEWSEVYPAMCAWAREHGYTPVLWGDYPIYLRMGWQAEADAQQS